MITILFSFIAAFMMNVAEPVQNDSFVEECSSAVVEAVATKDKYLGKVNLCDSEGNTCDWGEAYEDASNGRIYVLVQDNVNLGKNYAQKSNKPYWTHMIRFGKKWMYFSF